MIELKPEARIPATSATAPVTAIASDRVGEGREHLAGEDLLALDRAGEDRLQGVVAILGGDDVAGDQRGDQREHPDRAEEQQDERDRQAGVVDVAAEGDVVRAAALGDEGDDEDDRHQRRRAEAEVGALLGAQLAQLPAVDGAARRGSRRAPRQRRARGRAGAAAAVALGQPEEEVLEGGVAAGSARATSAPDSASASESAPTAASLVGAEGEAAVGAGAHLARSRPGPRRPRRATLVVGGPQPVAARRPGAAARRASPRRRRRPSGRSPPGCRALRPRPAGGWRAGRSSPAPRARGSGRACRASRRVEAGRRLVEQQQARLAQQRRGDPEPLAHPVRVAADPVLGAVGELDDLERLVDPRRRRRRRRARRSSSRLSRPLRYG